MPRPPHATFDRVAEAAGRLRSAGQAPTVRRLRAEIGGGSESTILKHLRDWLAREDIAVGSDETIAPTLASAILDEQARVAAKAVAAFRERMDLAEANLTDLQGALDQATGELAEVHVTLEQRREQVARLEGLRAHLEQEAANRREEMAQVAERLAAAEQRAATAEGQLQLLERLRVEEREVAQQRLRALEERLAAAEHREREAWRSVMPRDKR
jgi:hypothetical protein